MPRDSSFSEVLEISFLPDELYITARLYPSSAKK